MKETDYDKFKNATAINKTVSEEVNDGYNTTFKSQYMIIEKQIVKVNLDPNLKDNEQSVYQELNEYDVPTLQTTTNFATIKNIFAKRRSDLTGSLWGHKTSDMINPNEPLSNPIIDDVAKCLRCENTGLWGDECEECKSTYLILLAVCKLCHGQGYAGMPCYKCTENDPNAKRSPL